MGAPPDHGAKIRQDRVVQQRDIADQQQGPQDQHRQRHAHKLGPMRRPEPGWPSVCQLVHQPPDIPNQRHIGEGRQHRQHGGGREHLAKGADIVSQKRPQLARRRVGLGVGGIGVNQPLKELEHVFPALLRRDSASCKQVPPP